MKNALSGDIFKNKLKIFYKEKKTMNNDCFLELLCEMICMRPVSRDINAVNRVQRRVQEFLTEKGLFCTMEKDGEREVLFAATQPGKVHDILLCAHLDVVPAEVESQYEPYIENGVLYGRGSSDCMGNAIAIMKAMCTAPAGASLGCIFTGDEEIGGETTAYMVAQGYSARKMGLVMDSGGSVYYAQKGILNLTVTAHGSGGAISRLCLSKFGSFGISRTSLWILLPRTSSHEK